MTGETHTIGGTLFVLMGVPIVAPIFGVDVGPAELAIAAAVIGPMAAIIADADTPNSLVSRGWTPLGKLLGPLSYPFARFLGLFLSVPARVFGATARAGGVEHRGLTHTPQFLGLWTVGALPLYMLFFALFAYVISLFTAFTPLDFNPASVWDWQKAHFFALLPATMLYVFFGYLSHMVLDSCTKSGVPWLGKKTKYKDERGKWQSGYKSYNLGIPKRFLIVTGSPAETRYRVGIYLAVIIFVLLNIAMPIAERVDQGYSFTSSLTYSSAELAAGEGHQGGL